MCLIIHKAKDNSIDQSILRDAWVNNPDGCGIMLKSQHSGQAVMSKWSPSNFDFERFLYLVNDKYFDTEVGIHFRLATHGSVKKENSHPFRVQGKKVMLMHNGILPNANSLTEGKDVTDTKAFINRYLTIDNLHTILSDSKLVGNNRFLVLTKYGFTRYGDWTKHSDGNFYSNEYSLPWNDDYNFPDYYNYTDDHDIKIKLQKVIKNHFGLDTKGLSTNELIDELDYLLESKLYD